MQLEGKTAAMSRRGMYHIRRWLPCCVLTVVSILSFLAASSAGAAVWSADASGDTATLALDNGPTFIYGASLVPSFTVVITLAVPPKANHYWTVDIQLEDGESFGGSLLPSDSTGTTMTFTRITPGTPPASPPLRVGNHTATATFYNSETQTTATSNPRSFTVNQAATALDCSIDGNAAHFERAGQTLHMSMSPTAPGSLAPVDWQNATYSVTFDGPTHVSVSHLAPDSADEVTLTAPSAIGKYQVVCKFSGTASFTPADSTGVTYTFSAQNPLGAIQLFTHPTTLAAKQNLDFYLVFHAGAGLPTPTGAFSIYIGPYYTTAPLRLSSAGDALVHLSPLPSLSGVSGITIRYWGDVEYNVATATFPLTNPPIPNSGGSAGSGGSGGGSSGSGARATATTGSTANAQATATVDTTPTTVGPGGLVAAPPTGGGTQADLLEFSLLALLILAGLGGASLGALYLARRAKAARGAGNRRSGHLSAQAAALSNEETIPVPRREP